MQYHYIIYKITNLINNKIYIGSHKTKDLLDGYMGSGKYIKRSILKHGINNFKKEILFDFDNDEEMYNKELEVVNEDFINDESTYNLILGGCGGFSFINENGKNIYENHSLMTKKNIKFAHTAWMDIWNKSSEEYKNKYRKNISNKVKHWQSINGNPFDGRMHTNESKVKMSEYKKGKVDGDKNPMYGKCWINNNIISIICDKNNIPVGWNIGRIKKEKPIKVAIDRKELNVKLYLDIYNKFRDSGCNSLREFCRKGLYDKSHVNLTKMFKKYIPDLYNPDKGKCFNIIQSIC